LQNKNNVLQETFGQMEDEAKFSDSLSYQATSLS